MGGGGEGGYPTFVQLVHLFMLLPLFGTLDYVCGCLWYPLCGGGYWGDLRYLWGCTPGNGVKLVFDYTVLW